MLSVTAYGKINWVLDIVGKRPDGYHLMDMLMQTVSLGDELTFRLADRIELSGINSCGTLLEEGKEISAAPLQFDESNLIYRAAQLLREEYHIDSGVKIHLVKRIPFGAGMGGGSADAAATLIALNRLWRLKLSPAELCALGLQLGADIPFMLHGGLARVQGIGEQIMPFSGGADIPLVLLQGCSGVSTGTIFRYYDQFADPIAHPKLDECVQALRTSDWNRLKIYSKNVLQPVVAHFSPELEKGIEMLYSVGASFAQMTGSGSVVFGVFSSPGKAQKAAEQLRQQEKTSVWLAHSINNAWKDIENDEKQES